MDTERPLKWVCIDNCAWDHLFKSNVDLMCALPPERYQLGITKEVELEIL
jgi:hypothetical protein